MLVSAVCCWYLQCVCWYLQCVVGICSVCCWYLQCVMYQLLVLIIDPHIWLVPTLQLPSSSTPCVLPPLSDVSPQQNDNEIYNAAFSPGRTISASHLLCSEQILARAGQCWGQLNVSHHNNDAIYTYSNNWNILLQLSLVIHSIEIHH